MEAVPMNNFLLTVGLFRLGDRALEKARLPCLITSSRLSRCQTLPRSLQTYPADLLARGLLQVNL